ncbi:MAG: hypothetical protein ACYDDA_00445 [Acidiferrobacteraceae bacterium]
MASITYRGPRQWLVRIRRKGFPLQSKTLDTKAQAEAWVRQIEGEMDRGVFVSRAEAECTTLADALERYIQEYLPQLKHPYREISRARWIQRQPLATMFLAAIRGKDIAAFRDALAADGRAGGQYHPPAPRDAVPALQRRVPGMGHGEPEKSRGTRP